jgi:flagellar biosynthetic protein FliQ
MTPGEVLDVFRGALLLVVLQVVVLVLPSLVVGLLVSVFQAATQINEQTLSFLPRLLVTLATLMFTGPWLLRELSDHFAGIFASIPLLVG